MKIFKILQFGFHKNNKGFNLIEAIVSLLILSSGTLAAYSLLSYTNNLGTLSSNQLKATNLSREGIEIIRNIRDTNWLNFSGNLREHWNDSFDDIKNDFDINYIGYFIPEINLSATTDPKKFWSNLYTSTIPSQCSINADDYDYTLATDIQDLKECLALYNLCELNNIINYSNCEAPNAKPTQFYRQIQIKYLEDNYQTITNDPDNNIIQIDSIVTWPHENSYKSVILSTKLTDWYQRTDFN